MTSRAPRRVAAIVPKLSTWAPSGRDHASGTPERVMTAEPTAPARSLKTCSTRRSSATSTGSENPPFPRPCAARYLRIVQPPTAGCRNLWRETISARLLMRGPMEDGARLVLHTSAGLRSGEKVLIVADETTREIGQAFAHAASDLGADAVLAEMRPRAADGDEPPEPIGTAMAQSDVVLLVTSRSLSHTHARRAANRAGARVISMPGVAEAMLREGGLATDWAEIHEAVRRVSRRLRGGKEVRLTSAAWTDLTFEVGGREWITEDTGLCSRKGAFTTLPAGELLVAPVEGTAEGRLVADIFFDEALLEPAPAILSAGHASRIVGAGRAVHAMNRGG